MIFLSNKNKGWHLNLRGVLTKSQELQYLHLQAQQDCSNAEILIEDGELPESSKVFHSSCPYPQAPILKSETNSN